MTRFAVGVDLGGTNLRVAAIDEQGELLEQLRLPTVSEKGREDVVERLCHGVLEVINRWEPHSELAGIGIGLPGILDMHRGVWVASPNLPGWENFPIRELIAKYLKRPFYLDNDANLAALGEMWLGAGKSTKNLILLTMGTGIGGGLILDGRIWHGETGMAAELGHMTVYPDGRLCKCGNYGCLEEYASASALVKGAREFLEANKASPALQELADSGTTLTAPLVYQLALAGDASAQAVLRKMGVALGIAIGGLINVFDIRTIILGGGAMDAWDAFEESMFEEVAKRSYIFQRDPRQIVKASLGNQAGIYGAACLALQQAEERKVEV